MGKYLAHQFSIAISSAPPASGLRISYISDVDSVREHRIPSAVIQRWRNLQPFFSHHLQVVMILHGMAGNDEQMDIMDTWETSDFWLPDADSWRFTAALPSLPLGWRPLNAAGHCRIGEPIHQESWLRFVRFRILISKGAFDAVTIYKNHIAHWKGKVLKFHSCYYIVNRWVIFCTG